MKNYFWSILLFLGTACGTSELPKIVPMKQKVIMDKGLEEMIKNNKTDRALRYLTAEPKQIFSVNKDGQSLVHLTALRNRVEILEQLIKAGAPVNLQDDNGDTPLHLACYSRCTEAVKLLIDGGAQVNLLNKKSESPLHKAAVFCGIDVLQLLQSKGADLEALDAQKNRPIHVAAKYQNYPFVKKLIEEQAKENELNDNGDDILLSALKGLNSSTELESFLIDRLTNIAFCDKFKENYLHAAATNGKAHAVKLLLSKGADVNIRDGNGVVPILRALRHRKKEVAEILINNGAKLDVVDNDGRTLLHMMAFWLNEKTLLNRFTSVIDVNAVDKKGRAPLHEIAYWGHIKNALDLLESGAEINLKAKNGETPLYDAIKSKNYEMTETLIKKGAKVNNQNVSGDTPLKIAVLNDNEDLTIMTLLLENGADQNLANIHGETCMHEAVRYGKIEKIKLLLKYKPNLQAKDKFGKTAFDWAKERELQNVMPLLQ